MKCLIMARVSTEIQSLESQVEKLMTEANRLGYANDDIKIIQGKESGVKLDIEERQTIQEMKRELETGIYDLVLIWEVSRLARRPKVLYEVREWLIERHINLRCMTPSFTMLKEDGTIDPTASIVFALFGTMAEEEARLSKERMSRGKKHKQSLNGYIGGKPLYGYKFENDKLVIDYSKSEVVKKIYNMYETGMSCRSIALELMETGELKQTVLNNAYAQVERILFRPEYCGAKSETSGYTYPAIITKTQYEICKKLRGDKTKEHTRVKKICLCKRLIYCKNDGRVLSPNITKKQYRAWNINNNNNITISMTIMDDLVWKVVVNHVKKYGNKTDEETKRQLEIEANTSLRKVQQAMRTMKDLEIQIDRIENRIIEGKMSEIKGDQMIKEKRIEIKEAQETYDKHSYIYGQKMEMIMEGEYKIDLNNITDDQERQNIVRKYINRIYAEKTGLKRGDYYIEILMNDGVQYFYTFWVSGPWSKIEKIK